MAMREEYRPFNVEQAKVGALYGCLNDEVEVEILKYGDFYIYGIIKQPDGMHFNACQWTKTNGMVYMASHSRFDLVMLPIAHCQSKPVYVGDTLYDENGDKFEVEMVHVGLVPRCSWEAPRKVVETRMSDLALSQAEGFPGEEGKGLRGVANAAIARAIEDGDVIPTGEVYKVANDVLQLYGNAGSNPSVVFINGKSYYPKGE